MSKLRLCGIEQDRPGASEKRVSGSRPHVQLSTFWSWLTRLLVSEDKLSPQRTAPGGTYQLTSGADSRQYTFYAKP